jgi:hypothetical protein
LTLVQLEKYVIIKEKPQENINGEMPMSISRKVKCPGCNTYFYREEEAHIVIKNRYWHRKCYEERQQKDAASAQAIIDLENYICKLFSIEYIDARIRKQIKDMVERYHYTYSGIQGTLVYFFEIKRNSLDKANGGIGIVPYVYDEAKKYYETIFYAQQLNKDKDINSFITEEKTIIIQPPEAIRRNSLKEINLDFLEEGGLDEFEQ